MGTVRRNGLAPQTARKGQPMTVIDRKRRERQRKHDAGLVRLELWAAPQHHAAIKAFAQSLAGASPDPVAGAEPDPVAVSDPGGG